MADSGTPGRREGLDSCPPLLHHRRRPSSGGVGAGRSIRLVLGRRLIRSPTTAREAAHFDWGYSKPVVALDVAWNLAFAMTAARVLLSTGRERPSTPIRAWVFGYAVQCVLHVCFVWFEYRRRGRRGSPSGRRLWVAAGEEEDDDGQEESRESRAVQKLESLNAMASLFWWMIGFYWTVVGGKELLQDAPHLYWLTVVFLTFDVLFAIFCMMLACIIGIALCCCLPCTITFLYAIMDGKGASNAELVNLPKFQFSRVSQQEKLDLEEEHEVSINIKEKDSMVDLVLTPDDSECCICLSQYEDGVELHSLPCNHNFHSQCIVRWLRINATCPLCKYCIIDNDRKVSSK